MGLGARDMNTSSLARIARLLIADDKGLLAIDESNPTCNRRFAALGIAQDEETRRRWRELIITTPHLGQAISGVILYDETIRQSSRLGVPFLDILHEGGILAGIKVDMGTSDLAGHVGEKITEGLDGLRQRLASYAAMGASFAKWRAVFSIRPGQPSAGCIAANAHALARYAALCQEAGLVPILEPEVLMEGNHTIAECAAVSETVMRAVFSQACIQGVSLEGMVLKTNMVLAGEDSPVQAWLEDVAEATLTCLTRAVPAAVAAVLFLSGGQSAELASARLNALQAWRPQGRPCGKPPWPLSFSFARAIQQPALDIWRGHDTNVVAAQAMLLHRLRCDHAANRGEYQPEMETTT